MIRWREREVSLNWWEYAIAEEKQSFCKTECPRGEGTAECQEIFGTMVTKKLVRRETSMPAVQMEPYVESYRVQKCVRCGAVVSGGPFDVPRRAEKADAESQLAEGAETIAPGIAVLGQPVTVDPPPLVNVRAQQEAAAVPVSTTTPAGS